MDYRTATEKTIHTLIKDVMESFNIHKLGRVDFQTMMGKLRDIQKMLEYKEFGCPMGVHSSECLCSHNVIHTTQYMKYKRKVA